VGPYWLLARPRGSGGPARMRVVITTRQRYFDGKGKELQDARRAVRMEQTVESLEFLAVAPPDRALLGNWRLTSSRGPMSEVLQSAKWSFHRSRSFRSSQRGGGSQGGYFFNEGETLVLGRVDSGTFEMYRYEVEGKSLKVSARDDDGVLAAEWIFTKE
jgi:hypothetical protein